MHSVTPPPITTVLVLFFFSIFFYVDVRTSFASSETIPYCSETFNCGNLRNVSYPFTGGDRPGHCGLPEFRLSCVDDSPEITIASLSYRVLQLDPVRRTLTLARLDLWNETCPEKLINSTLGSSNLFTYGEENTDLTMFYRCNPRSINTTKQPENMFHCENAGSLSDSYFWLGQVAGNMILNVGNCSDNFTVPILHSSALKLINNGSLLVEVLMGGFNVNYRLPNEGGSNGISIGAGLGIAGACVFGILMGACLLYFIRKKREGISSKATMILFKKEYKTKEFDVETFIMSYTSFAPKRYTYANVKKMTNSFAKVIGKGGYGCVYKGTLPDGQLVAVKLLKDSKSDGEDFINEVASIGRTSHVNVVTLLGFCYERTKRALIYEYMPNGSLDKFIFKQESANTSRSLEWKMSYEIALGIARGLEYLHRGCNTRILHFDIKPQNILLDKDFCPKISDFGLAKLWLKKESIVSMIGARGTAGYIAPEVFSRNFGGVSHKSDVYSYGMLVLEMVGGRKNIDPLVSDTSEIYFPYSIYEDVELGNDLRVLGVTTDEEKEISRKMVLVSFWCIQTNPSNRPSMSKVVDMLEGSLQSVQIPPKPFLFSPATSPKQTTES